jgi:hypothetical protein
MAKKGKGKKKREGDLQFDFPFKPGFLLPGQEPFWQ